MLEHMSGVTSIPLTVLVNTAAGFERRNQRWTGTRACEFRAGRGTPCRHLDNATDRAKPRTSSEANIGATLYPRNFLARRVDEGGRRHSASS
jgi:hypothetical protein